MNTARRAAEPRDSQRQKVYDAEFSMAGREKNILTRSEVLTFIWDLRHNAALLRRYERELKTDISVLYHKGSRWAWAKPHSIHLTERGDWSRDTLVICHEIAHVITMRRYHPRGMKLVQAHGREFCAIYIDLVRFMISRADAEHLKYAFRAVKVKFTKKKTVAPISDERRQKLIETLAEARRIKNENKEKGNAIEYRRTRSR